MNRSLTPFAKPCLRLFAALTLAGSVLAGAPASAQGITVSAVGEATAQPDLLVFEGTMAESAELAQDAVVAFHDSRRRALASLEELGVEGLEVRPGALRVSRAGEMGGRGGMIMPGGGGEQLPPGQIAISQDVAIHITGVDTMDPDDLIDLILSISSAAKEAGIATTGGEMTPQDMIMMEMGQGGGTTDMATFRISDPEAAQQEATANAIAQARVKAQRLAELAGVELGPVTAITEVVETGEESSGDSYMNMIFGMMMGGGGGDPLASSSIEPITVRTALSVTFAIGGE